MGRPGISGAPHRRSRTSSTGRVTAAARALAGGWSLWARRPAPGRVAVSVPARAGGRVAVSAPASAGGRVAVSAPARAGAGLRGRAQPGPACRRVSSRPSPGSIAAGGPLGRPRRNGRAGHHGLPLGGARRGRRDVGPSGSAAPGAGYSGRGRVSHSRAGALPTGGMRPGPPRVPLRGGGTCRTLQAGGVHRGRGRVSFGGGAAQRALPTGGCAGVRPGFRSVGRDVPGSADRQGCAGCRSAEVGLGGLWRPAGGGGSPGSAGPREGARVRCGLRSCGPGGRGGLGRRGPRSGPGRPRTGEPCAAGRAAGSGGRRPRRRPAGPAVACPG